MNRVIRYECASPPPPFRGILSLIIMDEVFGMEWWGWLSTGLGAIVLIAKGIDAIKSIFSPVLKMDERLKTVEAHDAKDFERFDTVDAKINAVDSRMEAKFALQERTNQTILKSLAALINHEIDGNGIEGLKSAREDLYNHIIDRS